MTPLERAARALCDELRNQDAICYEDRGVTVLTFDGELHPEHLVRAVLNAIRVADEKARFAGSAVLASLARDLDPDSAWTDGEFCEEAATAWQVMTDAALEDG